MERIYLGLLEQKHGKLMGELKKEGEEAMKPTMLHTDTPDSFFPWIEAFGSWFHKLSGVKIEDLQEDEYIRFPMNIRQKITDEQVNIIGSDGVTELSYYLAHTVLCRSILDKGLVKRLKEESSWTLQKKIAYIQDLVLGEARPWERLDLITKELKLEPEDDSEQIFDKITAFEALTSQVKTIAPKSPDTELKLIYALCDFLEGNDSLLSRKSYELRYMFEVGVRVVPGFTYAKVLGQVKSLFTEE